MTNDKRQTRRRVPLRVCYLDDATGARSLALWRGHASSHLAALRQYKKAAPHDPRAAAATLKNTRPHYGQTVRTLTRRGYWRDCYTWTAAPAVEGGAA